jgi:hypothetical protein
MIFMENIGSFDPNLYRYINVRYRVITGLAGNVEIFFLNASCLNYCGSQSYTAPLISDATWRVVSIPMYQNANWLGSNITGWRFDWATANGVTMEIDFISLSADPMIAWGNSITVTPSANTTYFTRKKGICNNTTCVSQLITITSPSSAGILSGNQNICVNGSTTFLSTITNGTWTSNNTSVASVNASTGEISGISAGIATIIYTVVGTGGCANDSSTRTVTVTTPPISGTLSGNQNICVSGASTFESTVSGGSWSTSNPAVATINPITGVVSGVAGGTTIMTYTVDGNGGCPNATSTLILNVMPSIQTILGDITNECAGQSNGGINITVVGGVAPYVYTWSNGDTTQNIANLSAGNYQLIVSDDLGCQVTANYTISSNPLLPAPAAFQTAQAEVCQGQQGVIYRVSNVAGNDFYQWTLPSGVSVNGLDEFREISLNFSDSAQSGNIVVRAVDNCGAGDSIVFAIIVNENPQANLQSQNETCSASNGSIILSNISGGSGNYMYLWNNGSADTQINQLSAGNYSVEIFDLNTSCTVVYNRTIVNLASPVINATSTQATCGNSTGSATVNIVSGNAPYSIVWSDGQTNAQATNLFANTYTVTVIDTNLCETIATVNIGNSNGPSIDSTFQFAAACASNCNGMAGVIVSGGLAPYTYEWNTSPVRTTPTISNVCAGNYTVVVKDMNQCAVSSSINIGVAGSNPNINGVITRPGGQLITNGDVRVELYRVSNQPGVYPTLEAQTLSNSGLFSLLNFDIGDFIVLARPVVSSSPNLENTLRTYFNFTNRWDTATVLNATCN